MKPEEIKRWLYEDEGDFYDDLLGVVNDKYAPAQFPESYREAVTMVKILESLARCREDIDAILTGDNRIVVLIRPDLLKRLMSDVAGLPKEGDDDYSQDLPPLDETVRGLPDVTDD